MSEFIERLSPYTTQLPSESSERLASEAERKLWLVPEVVEVEEIQLEEPDLAASWHDVKQSFGSLKEHLRKSYVEVRAIGQLALLDVDKASSIINDFHPKPPQEDNYYQPLSFRDRVRLNAEDILSEKRYDRWKRRRENKSRANWTAVAIGGAALAGYLSDRLAEYLAKGI